MTFILKRHMLEVCKNPTTYECPGSMPEYDNLLGVLLEAIDARIQTTQEAIK